MMTYKVSYVVIGGEHPGAIVNEFHRPEEGGHVKAPDHARPAREMLRVVRDGGRIGLANWTPEGFIGQLFKIVGSYIPAPSGLKSPALWGTEPHIVELFGADAMDIRTNRKNFNFRYRSAAHWIQIFRNFYGPIHKAFAALDPGAI